MALVGHLNDWPWGQRFQTQTWWVEDKSSSPVNLLGYRVFNFVVVWLETLSRATFATYYNLLFTLSSGKSRNLEFKSAFSCLIIIIVIISNNLANKINE